MKDPDLVRPERYRHIENAVEYDRHIRPENFGRRLSHWLEIRAFERALTRIRGTNVLDAPCGTGRIHRILSNRFSVVVSLDSSESMLKMHGSNTGAEEICCGDIFCLPFLDEWFDWAVAYRLFHHLQSHEIRVALLKSIGRVSRNGVLFTAWIDTPLNRRRRSRRRSLTRKELEEAVFEAGLVVTHIDFACWPFQPKCVVTCRKEGRR